MAANKKATVGHVVYDSGADMASGKKRAVLTGGASVAERARLFGAQIQQSTPVKTSNSASHPPKRPSPSAQPPKANVNHQEGTYQPPRTDIDRRPKQDAFYSNPPRAPTTYRPAAEMNERPRREPVPAGPTNHYSKAARSYNQKSHSPPRRRPVDSYDNFQHVSSHRQAFNKTKPPQRMSSESYTSEDEDTYSALYDKAVPARHATYQTPKYFQPIQDPLDVLFKDSPHEYIQQPVVMQKPPPEVTNLQEFDLGTLINRIQQDYADHARPYVSSVQFVQHNQSLANIGFVTPMTGRKDYVRRPANNYSRQAPLSSHQYDIINANGFNPYEKMHSRSQYDDNHYSSIRRRRQHKHYHNQASSPIHVLEISSKAKSRPKPETPPPPKVPTPVATSSSEEEEEATPATTQSATAVTPEKAESSSEAESESEEESEEETAPAPPLPTPLQTVNGPNRTSGTLPNGAARPPLPGQTPTTAPRNPAPTSESEESDSEESESDSDSDSDDDDKTKKKKKTTKSTPQPMPATRQPPQRTTPSTPQANPRVAPQANPRVAPQRGTYENNSFNDPPESSHSVHSFDVQEPAKSSISGKLKSFTGRFRRNKS